MNLIEQLGGYEKAKEVYKNFKDDSSSLNRQHALNVKISMLEHRRQYNIYEVGDLITHPAYDWKILKVHDPIKSEDLLFAKTNDHVKHHWGHGLVFDDKYVVAVSYSECRHATDAEIKAGKRL